MRKLMVTLGLVGLLASPVLAQKRDLDNYRQPDQRGLNVFEDPKDTISTFDGLNVRVGGAFALQYQGISHKNAGDVELIDIKKNFNLATANLDLDVELYDGIRLHLRTYLSSRHHPEPYVKGGYMQVDNLNFIEEGFLSDYMKYLTVRVGHMEVNYGDAHFRRSDNAQALYNPFVGNLIMDSFTTEVGAEVYYQNNGWLAMAGMTNGELNQSVGTGGTQGSIVGKLGYDKQETEDLRWRLTGSIYHTGGSARTWLYNGDRAGARYYFVMEEPDASSAGNFTSGRVNPMMVNEMTSIMINPFVKYKGLEFFGVFEHVSGKEKSELKTRTFNQYAAELLYRFGNNEEFYVAGRYNLVKGTEFMTNNDIEIDRINLGAGWFMTKNILAKLEYVRQTYDGYSTGSKFNGGEFDGVVLEAVISF